MSPTSVLSDRLQAGVLATLVVFAAACGAPRGGPTDGAPTPEATAPRDAGAAHREGTRSTAPPRHLVLVTIDTLRADRVGAWGDSLARTPHLDRLAAEGLRFEHAIAPVPLTLPTHAVLMTGKRPFEIGVRVNGFDRLEREHRTLATILGEQGWETAAMVASYVLTAKFGLDQGFATYDDRLGTERLEEGFASEIPADRVNDKVRAWLEARDRDPQRRVFLWVHYYDPHLPYEPPPDVAPDLDPYRGEIAFVDQQLGRLLELLDDDGLGRDALLVVTSDHGEAFLEHGEEGHGLLTYQETLAVPLLLHHPGSIEPGVAPDRHGLVEIAPTVLSLLGLEPAAGMSESRLVDRPREDPRVGPPPEPSPIYFESLAGQVLEGWAPIHGVVEGDHKLIAYREEPELFDLRADPGETRNLIGDEPGVARRLSARLRGLDTGPDAGPEPRAELDAADREHLEALGYLGSGGLGQGGGSGLDPRRGMEIEMELRRIRSLVEAGAAAEARSRLRALEERAPQVRTPDHFELAAELANDPAEALERLRVGVERFPAYFPLRFVYASRLLAAGESEAARAQALRLVEDPRRSEAWNLLGRIAEGRGAFEEAVEAYRQALAIEQGSVPFRLRLADVLVRTGQMREALDLYEEALADGFVEDPEIFQRAALLASRIGEIDRAEQLFRRGLAADPGPLYQLAWGLFLAERGRRDEAIVALRQVVGSPEVPAEPRAMARAILGQLESAGQSGAEGEP